VEAYGDAGTVFWHEIETYPQAAANLWNGAQTTSATSTSGISWGQCVWFVDSNFYRELIGNGGVIYANAVKAGLPTLPPSQIPPVGAVVSFQGASYSGGYGHTAVVVYSDPNGHYYIVAEANFWKEVSTSNGQTTVGVDMREIPFPDAQLQGSVLPRKALPVPVIGDLQQIIANGGKIVSGHET
jgi:surface antigen